MSKGLKRTIFIFICLMFCISYIKTISYKGIKVGYYTYEPYFYKYIAILIMLLIIIFSAWRYLSPNIKKNIIRRSIRENIKKENFLLYYQPIINPRKNKEIGFEALLRLIDEKKDVFTPEYFIKDIEKSEMLCEVTLWILKKVINDYKIIREYPNIENKEFYISINLSIKELETEEFVYKASKIAVENNIEKNSVCLEILEGVCISDLNKIKKSIAVLKSNGFKIAIDDFGVEYSNLDILEKFDFDIIKLDKRFIGNIEKSELSNEVMNFMSNITLITNTTLVIEGVEEKAQIDIIKCINNDNLYIQGYFYSKPVSIEELKKFSLRNKNNL